ncbi:Sarcosine dehydrogenase, mitochondrial [Armadillidium vulgare]|nr:Sarcosine dehydrogenase, mitochondrial [Armadillidium vulgare]
MSYFGQIYMTGPDSQKAADWLFTANMRKKPGSVVYTCMANEQGGIEADLTVSVVDGSDICSWEPSFNEERGFYIAAGGGATLQNKAHIMKEIRKNKWNVSLHDFTEKMGTLSLQGPKSRDILQELTNTDLSNESFPFSSHKVIDIAGQRVRAIRLSFVGELGWELHIPEAAALPVYEAIHEVGKKYGLVNGGYRALDSLSCEKGYVLWHADIRPDDTPLEAGLQFTCKLKASESFLGREALLIQKDQKPKKKLVTFTLNDPSVAIHGLEGILRDGEPVGYVRRAEYAFYLGTSIARGYVKNPSGSEVSKEFLNTGKWKIDVMGETHPITVHLTSPFDPKNLRIKGIYEDQNNTKQ